MIEITAGREIIDRDALVRRLDAIVARSGRSEPPRGNLLELFKETLARGREEVRRRFDAGAAGAETVRANAFLVDQLVRLIYDFAFERAYPLANPTAGEKLAVVAVGGYGRGELAPHSDVDLLFLFSYKQTPHTEQVVEYILYMLWDLGLKVGHAARSIDDCIRLAKADHTVRTGILEARYVWGDRRLYAELERRFAAEVVDGTDIEFVEAKLTERDQRHRRMGDSRYVIEPHIKDGKGGLRDLHTLFWIAKYLYRVDDVRELVERGVLTRNEFAKFAKAQNFLWTLRCTLHYLAGRPEDRLTLDVQAEIGSRMGYTDHAGTSGVERFMKHYFLVAKDVGDLTRIFCAALEAEHKRKPRSSLLRFGWIRREIDGFALDGGRLTVTSEGALVRDPIMMIRLFHTAQENALDVHPRALRLITRNLKLIDAGIREDPEANRLFLEILTAPKDPETALRRMNEAGVLGRFLPDFGRVVAQMQYDMYHAYTVDEHSIFAIGILSRIEKGLMKDDHPLASEVVHKLLSRRALYLAVLLHDIAKGRGGDHSEIGARIADRLGPRLGLPAEETEQVSWLVRHHLILSDTALKRDVHDPKTVSDFVAAVQSPERLRLLLVLTAADMRATGPHVWNAWKAALLSELYLHAEEVMLGGLAVTDAARVEKAKAAVGVALADWGEDERAAHLARGPVSYWLSADTATHVRHAHLVREAEESKTPLAVDTRVDRSRAVTEVTVYTADRPGLFSRIAGAMAVSGASIVDARIFNLANGKALDSFWVQDAEGGVFDRPDRLARLEAAIEESLEGRLEPDVELAGRRVLSRRLQAFEVPPRVLIDNKASAEHTVIEVNGRDRPGLLYDMTRAVADLGLQVSSAKISTYGERVVDVFYVRDAFDLKIEHQDKVEQVRERLLAALAEPEGRTAARPRPGAGAGRGRRRTAGRSAGSVRAAQ